MVSIVHWLVAEGLLDDRHAAWALEQQRRHGGYVGDHLVGAGFITADDFFAALSRAWRQSPRDLVAEPPQPALLAEVDVERTIELGWVACELTDDGAVLVASSVAPTEDLVVEVLEHFPTRRVEFVACTRDDLDSVALAVRVDRLGGEGRTTPRRLVRPVHVVLAFLGTALAVAGATLLPPGVLAALLLAASVLFLVGGVMQALTGYAALVSAPPLAAEAPERPSGAPEDAEGDDVDLPLYTVIVRVCGGRAGLDELFDNFRRVDYPRNRTDGIIVVSREDHDTLAALRETAPRGWVRVARVPEADFVDVVRACDHGLALARGRYVVAFDQDERPAPDQLRRAVAVFEADLDDRLAGTAPAEPLAGLRVAHRPGSQPFGLDRLAAADEAAGFGTSGGGPARSADVTGVHFNMRLLRRLGGFGLLLARGPAVGGERPPRIESLESSSDRGSSALARRWWDQQVDAFSEDVLEVAGRTLALLRPGASRPPEEATAVAARLGAMCLLLTYPVVLGGGVAAALRSDGADDSLVGHVAWVALGELVLVVGAVVGVAAVLLARRRDWRSAPAALALPVLWLLHAFAAWAALYAVVLRTRAAERG